MKAERVIIKAVIAWAFICGLSLSAQAQIGSGWTPIEESYVPKTSDGGTIIPFPQPQIVPGPEGAIFSLPLDYGVAEYQYEILPLTTTEQLEAFLTVEALGGSQADVLQTGPCVLAIRKSPPYILDALSGNILADYPVGTMIRVNTIYTPAAGTVDLYINGVQVEEKIVAALPVYNVVGIWAPAVSTAASPIPDEVAWRTISFWEGGVK